MDVETEQYEGRAGPITATKREILGNTYVTLVVPHKDKWHTHSVMVFGDAMTGEDHGIHRRPGLNGYNKLETKKVMSGDTLGDVVSESVDSAVTKLQKHLEHNASKEDEVIGAVNAVAEYREERD